MKLLVPHRQLTPYSCGPACLQTVFKTLFPHSRVVQEALGAELNTMPKIGTCHEQLAKLAAEHLPVVDAREDTYRGGMAIANIRNPLSGNGHYVVMLFSDIRHTRYYCPLINRVVTLPTRLLDWRNGDESLCRWSVNFATG